MTDQAPQTISTEDSPENTNGVEADTSAAETPPAETTEDTATESGAADVVDGAEAAETVAFRPGAFTIGRKIGAVVAICLTFLCAISAASIYQMEQIAVEIEAIAERDTPMVEMVSKITTHQLEQSIYFERAFRYAEETITIPDAKADYEKALKSYNKYSKLLAKEVKVGEKMAEAAAKASVTPEARKEFTHILEVLETYEVQHAEFEKHVDEALALMIRGSLVDARKLAKTIDKEEAKLNTDLEALLHEIEKFTEKSAQKAQAHEEFAVQFVLIMTIVGVLIAMIAAWAVAKFTIVSPLKSALSAIQSLQAGDLDIVITTKSRDEIGAVSHALTDFQRSMIESERLREESESREREVLRSRMKMEQAQRESEEKAEEARRLAEEKAAEERRESLLELAQMFEQEVGSVVTEITGASDSLKTNAQSLRTNADEASSQSSAVAAASEETTTSVQTVASAAEELSASIQEITPPGLGERNNGTQCRYRGQDRK